MIIRTLQMWPMRLSKVAQLLVVQALPLHKPVCYFKFTCLCYGLVLCPVQWPHPGLKRAHFFLGQRYLGVLGFSYLQPLFTWEE